MSLEITRQHKKDAYNDSPELHPNVVFGSFQLLFWIIFHRSAWRNHIARIDSALPPDFTLSELTTEQWRSPVLHRIMLIGYVIWPLWVGLLVAILLSLSGKYLVEDFCIAHTFPPKGTIETKEEVLIQVNSDCQFLARPNEKYVVRDVIKFKAEDVAIGIALGLTNALAVAVIIGVASGVATGIVGGVVSGILSGVLVAIIPLDIGVTIEGTPIFVVNPTLTAACVGIVYGLTAGIMGSVAFSIAVKTSKEYFLTTKQIFLVAGTLSGFLIIGFLLPIPVGSTIYLTITEWVLGRIFRVEEAASVLVFVLGGMVLTLSIGIIVTANTRSWKRGLIFGLLIGVASALIAGVAYNLGTHFTNGVVFAIGFGIVYGLANSALFSLMFVIPRAITVMLAPELAGAIVGALTSGISGPIFYVFFVITTVEPKPSTRQVIIILLLNIACIFLGFTQIWWRSVILYPFFSAWNTIIYRIDEQFPQIQPSLLRFNSAFWNEHQGILLLSLADHLLLISTRDNQEGRTAINYLTSKPVQHLAVQAVQIELDARALEACRDLEAIGEAHKKLMAVGKLIGPTERLLRALDDISRDVANALDPEVNARDQRTALNAVKGNLEGILRELTRSNEPYANRFHPITSHWHQCITTRVKELDREIEESKEIYSPYIVGMPITKHQKIFVGRTDIGREIGRYFFYDQSPPIFLYGQRRMGKTSLLRNLERLLPRTLISIYVYVDLQGAATADRRTSTFFYWIAKSLVLATRDQHELELISLTREQLAIDPFTTFVEWLDEVEITLDVHGLKNVLIALDEIEAARKLIDEGTGFSEADSLGVLRHLIQHRSRFKVLVAGAHNLNEMPYLAHYLINAHTIHINYLDETAARKLIEHPVDDFPLRYEPEASKRVLNLTRGHPYLTQLLCDRIVSFKNKQQLGFRRLVRPADVEVIVPEALNYDAAFFIDIQNWVNDDGLSLLHFLAAQGEGAIVSQEVLARQIRRSDELKQTLALLVQRELIETVDEGYRFQVELIRRYFETEAKGM